MQYRTSMSVPLFFMFAFNFTFFFLICSPRDTFSYLATMFNSTSIHVRPKIGNREKHQENIAYARENRGNAIYNIGKSERKWQEAYRELPIAVNRDFSDTSLPVLKSLHIKTKQSVNVWGISIIFPCTCFFVQQSLVSVPGSCG